MSDTRLRRVGRPGRTLEQGGPQAQALTASNHLTLDPNRVDLALRLTGNRRPPQSLLSLFKGVHEKLGVLVAWIDTPLPSLLFDCLQLIFDNPQLARFS